MTGRRSPVRGRSLSSSGARAAGGRSPTTIPPRIQRRLHRRTSRARDSDRRRVRDGYSDSIRNHGGVALRLRSLRLLCPGLPHLGYSPGRERLAPGSSLPDAGGGRRKGGSRGGVLGAPGPMSGMQGVRIRLSRGGPLRSPPGTGPRPDSEASGKQAPTESGALGSHSSGHTQGDVRRRAVTPNDRSRQRSRPASSR